MESGPEDLKKAINELKDAMHIQFKEQNEFLVKRFREQDEFLVESLNKIVEDVQPTLQDHEDRISTLESP